MCLLCPSSPHPEKDPFYKYQSRHWETGMLKSCCHSPGVCLVTCFCGPCCACHLRDKALQGDFSKYSCCQGYVCSSCANCVPGQDSCPKCCCCLEVICCYGCAISATRAFVQDERQIMTDPCDNRIIAFNNCMQILSCICNILAIFIDGLQQAAAIIDCIADITWWITSSCVQTQTYVELRAHPTVNDY